MQVSVEAGEGAERILKIEVPAEVLDQELENRLKSMSGNIKIDGFRPGKVPFSVIKKQYGGRVFHDVAGEIIQSSFRDAITQESLSIVGEPTITPEKMEPGQPLIYTATFDVAEEITLNPVSDIKLERLDAKVEDADVDNMIETLRKQRVVWNETESPAKEGDKVSISFKGTVDGEAFSGGEAENVPVIIGSGSMIPGFEEQLTGLAKAGTTIIKTPFPDDYHEKSLAGKDAEFAIEVISVESSSLPEVDEAFVKEFGIEDGTVEKLKEEIKANMERELINRVKMDLKAKVMNQLDENNQINVPKSIVRQEAQELQKRDAENMQGQELPIETYTKDATKRVKLGMLLGEVIKQSGITSSPDLVKARVEEMAKEYSDPEEFVKHYYSNQDLLRSVESIVMEDMTVDWIVSNAKVTDVKSTFDELMNPEK